MIVFRSPTYCASLSQAAREKLFQCIHSATFGLIVHGLWPQVAKAANVRAHPRNCRNEPQLNATFVKRFYCIMPDEDLMQGEWEKHGRWPRRSFNSPVDVHYHPQLTIQWWFPEVLEPYLSSTAPALISCLNGNIIFHSFNTDCPINGVHCLYLSFRYLLLREADRLLPGHRKALQSTSTSTSQHYGKCQSTRD